jgi:hypothetical protein
VREHLDLRWKVQFSDSDIIRAVEATVSAMRPAQPAVAAATPVAAIDAEAQVASLFSLLHAFKDASPDAPPPPPGLDEQICHRLQVVLAMAHNRALARRVHAQARAFAGALPQGSPDQLAAARAQVTIFF